jgi:hypothetical protein
MNIGYDELYYALEESLRLQSHYATLLNQYDNGRRIEFNTIKDWCKRLRDRNETWNENRINKTRT